MRAESELLALALGGGGARGAYQVGVLRSLARQFPDLSFPILTGVSAGAINTVFLAARDTPLAETTDALRALWLSLGPEQVYDVRPHALVGRVLRTGWRLVSGNVMPGRQEPLHGMLNTAPLRAFLQRALEPTSDGSLSGIRGNLARGSLRAVAVSGTSYATGHSMTWIEGREVELWQRPHRRTELTALTVDHVLASCALPILFPAVQVRDQWYGDGGIGLTAPLSPALHLGATKILTISTRHIQDPSHESLATIRPYPPPAQVAGVLYNSIFMDLVDEDIQRLQKINAMLRACPDPAAHGMREVDIFVIRPSRDLRALAHDLEPQLPLVFRHLLRGLGTREASASDLLSLVMFQREYVHRVIELGERDAFNVSRDISAFLSRGGAHRTLSEFAR